MALDRSHCSTERQEKEDRKQDEAEYKGDEKERHGEGMRVVMFECGKEGRVRGETGKKSALGWHRLSLSLQGEQLKYTQFQ